MAEQLDLFDDDAFADTEDGGDVIAAAAEEESFVEVAEVAEDADESSEDVEDDTSELEETDLSDFTARERALMRQLDEANSQRVVPTTATIDDAADDEDSNQSVDFLADMDIDDVLSTTENFNQVLTAVYRRGLEDAKKLAAEQIMRDLPSVMSTYVTRHLSMREMVNQFYVENPELQEVKRVVANVANEVSANNPELSLDEVFKQAGERTYKMLGLRKGQSKQTQRANKGKNTLVQPRGNGRVKVEEVQGVEGEIADLFNL